MELKVTNYTFIMRSAVIAFVGAVLLLALVITSYSTATYDVYWHLAMGRELVENHIFPSTDDFSFTWQGRELSSFPYLFQMLIYLLVDTFGYDLGTHLYLFGVFVSVTIAACYYLKKINANPALFCMTIAGLALFLNFRLLIRPELFSYFFIVIAFIFYKQAATNFCKNTLWPIFLLMLLWVNYHSVVFGYVIFFGLYVDIGIRFLAEKRPSKDWMLWVVSGALLVFLGFMNPFFYHGVLATLKMDNAWYGYIQEYQNIFYTFSRYPGAIPAVFAALLALVLAVKLKRYGYLVVLLVFLLGAIQYSRILVASGIVMLLILADLLSDQYSHIELPNSFKMLSKAGSILLLVSFVPLYFSWYFFYTPQDTQMPENLKNYFLSKHYEGNILNNYAVGGFLIYSLYPQARVFIDGRTDILYDVAFFEKYQRVITNSDELKAAVAEYNIDYIVNRNSPDYNNVIYKSEMFALDYMDEGYSLYKKGSANFPISGFIISQSGCWASKYKNAMQSELYTSKNIQGITSVLTEFQDNVLRYENSPQKNLYIQKFVRKQTGSAIDVRFMAYQALGLKEYKLSEKLFLTLPFSQAKDYLARAFILLSAGKYQEAANILKIIYMADSFYISEHDWLVFYVLGMDLNHQSQKKLVDADVLDGIRRYLEDLNIDIDNIRAGANLFCDKSFEKFGQIN